MRNIFLAVFITGLFFIGVGFALDGTSSTDKSQIVEQKQAVREHSQAAKAEAHQLKEQIQAAKQAGDWATVKQLKGALTLKGSPSYHLRKGLKTLHGEHMQQKKEDLQGLKAARQEFRQDARPQGQGQGNPPGYNPPGQGPMNPPGYNPPGRGAGNPPGYNPPGRGQGNPPGYNPTRIDPPIHLKEGSNPPGRGPGRGIGGGPKPGAGGGSHSGGGRGGRR